MPYGATIAQLEAGNVYKAIVPQKIPIGGSIKGARKPGLFKVYVPSRDGPTLELKTTAGTLDVFAPDGSPARNSAGAPVASGSTVKFDVPDGTFGWFGVVVRDSASYEVSAKLTITGNARDPQGKMVIPWHFFYFPFVNVDQDGANHPSAKFQKKFGGQANDWEKTSYWKGVVSGTGKSGTHGHSITKAACTEYNNWSGRNVVTFENCDWWGHCDAASVASAIFEQPKGTGDFTESDLEYFATEIAMCGYDIELKFFLGGINNDDRGHPSHTEKPEDRLGQTLDQDIGALHEAVIDVIKKQGAVALIDMRADYVAGKDKSPDVWNQATYKFSMTAKQAKADTGAGDEEANARALEFHTILNANADAHNSAGNPESPANSGWDRELYYVLHFDDKGKAATTHPQNNYKKCTWAKTGSEYYSPRYVFQIKGLRPGAGGPGNPHITLAKAQQAGLKMRPQYAG